MYLKTLEMQGFKSFCEKIRLDFNTGITAVVGPNGSGKSNIADAVRWVLGEQSAKSLRGAKMEDVIFAGTQNRRPLGFAAVSITIDNSDRKLPISYNEIKITRKVFRSGDSEYQINGTNCRLKDIHEMFMDTGIGREGYSIIGQGRIEEILSTRSEERRFLFEEATGIVKFKNRKQEAMSKLERERINLVRVNDIISVLNSQLEPLFAQAEKAKQYLLLKENLKHIQVNVFLIQSQKLKAELSNIEQNIDNLAQDILLEKEKSLCLKAEIEQFKAKLAEIELAMKTTASKAVELRSKLEQNENDVKFYKGQIESMTTDATKTENYIAKKLEVLAQLEELRTLQLAKQNALNLEILAKNELLAEKTNEFNLLSEKMSDEELKIGKFNEEIIRHIKLANQAKSDTINMKNQYEQCEFRKEKINDDKTENQLQLDEKSSRLETTQDTIANIKKATELVINEQEVLKMENISLSTNHKNVFENFTKNKNDLSQVRSKLKLLSDYENNYEGYLKSVKYILLEKRKNPTSFNGICGAVGELLQTEKAYETAVDIALGASVQNVIVEAENDARKAIEYLKQNHLGRATFLPLSAIKPREIGEIGKTIAKEVGFLGVCKDLISYDKRYENIFSNLLGKTIIVDNMANALNLYKKYNYAYKIVTLDGELLNAGGAITGGSIYQKTSSLFGRSREIKTLSEDIVSYELQISKAEIEIQHLSEQLNIVNNKMAENQTFIQDKAIEIATFSETKLQLSTQIEALQIQQNGLNEQDELLITQLINTNNEMRRFEKIEVEIELEIVSIKEKLDDYQSTIVETRAIKDAEIRKLTDIKVELSALEQNLLSVKTDINRLQNEIKTNKNETEALKLENKDVEAKIVEKESEILRTNEFIVQLVQLQKQENEKIIAFEIKKSNINSSVESCENASEALISNIFALENEFTKLQLKLEHTKEENKKIYDDLWEEYSLTPVSALEYYDENVTFDQSKRDERQLKTQILELGDVFVGAIEEFKQIKSRHDEMAEQRDDIVDAEAKLLQLIDELTKLMELQFVEQFAVISENFSKVFIEMFHGGKAYLKLTDEKNVLQSGIDIIAQPPGKNLQSMSLLSGGERSLTATALLFGILLMKPSPFCILDEVEAALDDSNVLRYAQFIKNFAYDTQFILITHRKGTMEAADVLYGVTMQEQGVSKLVSVNLEKNEMERV